MSRLTIRLLAAILPVVILSGVANAQNNHPTETFVIARTGIYTQDGAAAYHYAQVLQARGRWIFPDVGYIDFADARHYREVFVGAGIVVLNTKYLTVIEEAYLDKATGPASGGALYIQPWTYVGYRLTPKLGGEAVYFPYLPLNQAGRIQHVIDRAKLEYDFKRFKAGGGYGAYRFADDSWQNKPFITATLKAGALGDLEFWLQRIPDRHLQLQVRYAKIFR